MDYLTIPCDPEGDDYSLRKRLVTVHTRCSSCGYDHASRDLAIKFFRACSTESYACTMIAPYPCNSISEPAETLRESLDQFSSRLKEVNRILALDDARRAGINLYHVFPKELVWVVLDWISDFTTDNVMHGLDRDAHRGQVSYLEVVQDCNQAE